MLDVAPITEDEHSDPLPVEECAVGDIYWGGPDYPLWMIVDSDKRAEWVRSNGSSVRRLKVKLTG